MSEVSELDHNKKSGMKVTSMFPRLTFNDLSIAAGEEISKISNATKQPHANNNNNNNNNNNSKSVPPIVPPKIKSPRIDYNVLEDSDSRPTWVSCFFFYYYISLLFHVT